MPVRTIAGTDIAYYLIAFDEHGAERRETDGTLLSETVMSKVGVASDVFLISHGWQGDLPAAIEQYDRWVDAMARQTFDLEAIRLRRGRFAPLIIGWHWPSRLWGDETLPASGGGSLLSARGDVDAMVEDCAKQIADTSKARAAIRTVLSAATSMEPVTLTPALNDAYATIFAESGLSNAGVQGAPGTDQDGFDPQAIIADARAARGTGVPGLLGSDDDLRSVFLMPLRQLSFWKMKDRARLFGETGAHRMLSSLQQAAPSARFHLMGHSFGCIVVSASVAAQPPLLRPVDSLFLVQGALSLWSYSPDIPYAAGIPGYFNQIIKRKLVSGPILTTRSIHDTAVRQFY
ncbi:MAG TPA: hypothetical protein VI653_04590, partial [Steroidobacteraceae bacterium]